MNIPFIDINSYNYILPDKNIASFPLKDRDSSKLLVFNKQQDIEESIFKKIDSFLPSNSILIGNNTKVVPARLLFYTTSGALIEIFYLEPFQKNIADALESKASVNIKAYIGNARKWKNPELIQDIFIEGVSCIIYAKILEKVDDYYIIHISWSTISLSFSDILHAFGKIPLPPYIKRNTESIDTERYQTTYAQHLGSVAAPTAGLHFTNNVLDQLKQKNITVDYITLHVGAGTFKPIKSEKVDEHIMHQENIHVSAIFLEKLIQNIESLIISIGTTTIRSLESLYWLGILLSEKENLSETELIVEQWLPYTKKAFLSKQESLKHVLAYMKKKNRVHISFKTNILIIPGYNFQLSQALITNFHQPKSTLLLLISAFIGDSWKKIYEYALTHDFRFLSYGDASLLWKKDI